MHNSRPRTSGTAAVLALAAAAAFSVSSGTASAAPVPARSSAQAVAPLAVPAGSRFSIPASFRRVTATALTGFHLVSPAAHRLVGVGPNAAAARPGAQGTKNTEYSTNWSGYVADAGGYSSVLAGWTQPAADCSGTSGLTDAAFWVGLDGFGSSTVEQTGSDAVCSDGSASYGAWFEAYPEPSYGYDATVEPGDQFYAYVSGSGDSYELVIEDDTQGWYGAQDVTVPGAEDASAEIIAEAPSSGGILPLTNFGTVAFSDAQADGDGFGSLSPVQLDMVSSSGALEAETSALPSTNAFSVTWISE
jgi:Peptidase A4 family